jgi:hypothetical protein
MWAYASVCVQESHVRTKATGSVLPLLSSRFGNKRDDYVLYECFLKFKYRYIVSFQYTSRIPQMQRHGCIYNRRSAYLSGFYSGKGRGQQDAEHVMPYSL